MREHVPERDVGRGSGLHGERALRLGRRARAEQREGVVSARGRADSQGSPRLSDPWRLEHHVHRHLRPGVRTWRRRQCLVYVEVVVVNLK